MPKGAKSTVNGALNNVEAVVEVTREKIPEQRNREYLLLKVVTKEPIAPPQPDSPVVLRFTLPSASKLRNFVELAVQSSGSGGKNASDW